MAILFGRDAGWQAQRRDDGSIPFRQIVRLYVWHTAFGISLAVASYLVSPYLLAWMSPVVIGQALAIPLPMLTSSTQAGQILRRVGLLRIPEEVAPPSVLSEAGSIALAFGHREPADAMRRLRDDAALRQVHLAMLPASRRRSENVSLATGLAKLEEAQTVEQAVTSLTKQEKSAVLGDPAGITRLMGLS